MKNKFLSLIIVVSLFTGCDDFTEQNLEEGKAPEATVDNVDLLLGEGSNVNNGTFSIEKLIANTGSFVTAPLVNKLSNRAKELSSSIKQYCQSLDVLTTLDTTQVEALRLPIQENWKNTMGLYHQIAMMNYGPMAAATSTAMSAMYSFDGQEKCKVDTTLLQIDRGGSRRLPRLDVIDNYNVRGLDTIEALFFSKPNQTNARCSRRNSRVTKWFEKPLLEREKQICLFATHLAKEVLAKSEELHKAWSPLNGHYTAGMLRGTYGSTVEITNQISQALFFLDTNTKDVKLSYPAGFEVRVGDINTRCDDASCPQNREHPYSEFGFDALEYSLIGFKKLFQGISDNNGKNGFGLDDLLRDRDHSDIANSMLANIDLVIENVRTIKSKVTLKDALSAIDQTKCEQTTSENRLEEMCALVWDIRKVTDILKNDYLSALQELSAPRNAQGDND